MMQFDSDQKRTAKVQMGEGYPFAVAKKGNVMLQS